MSWSKERFQQVAANIKAQALRTIEQVDAADRDIIANIRERDPKLADLLDRGTSQRREASLAILQHLGHRTEAGEKR